MSSSKTCAGVAFRAGNSPVAGIRSSPRMCATSSRPAREARSADAPEPFPGTLQRPDVRALRAASVSCSPARRARAASAPPAVVAPAARSSSYSSERQVRARGVNGSTAQLSPVARQGESDGISGLVEKEYRMARLQLNTVIIAKMTHRVREGRTQVGIGSTHIQSSDGREVDRPITVLGLQMKILDAALKYSDLKVPSLRNETPTAWVAVAPQIMGQRIRKNERGPQL